MSFVNGLFFDYHAAPVFAVTKIAKYIDNFRILCYNNSTIHRERREGQT